MKLLPDADVTYISNLVDRADQMAQRAYDLTQQAKERREAAQADHTARITRATMARLAYQQAIVEEKTAEEAYQAARSAATKHGAPPQTKRGQGASADDYAIHAAAEYRLLVDAGHIERPRRSTDHPRKKRK